jgi:hypothetical protein
VTEILDRDYFRSIYFREPRNLDPAVALAQDARGLCP